MRHRVGERQMEDREKCIGGPGYERFKQIVTVDI